jgi:hypothetical protein
VSETDLQRAKRTLAIQDVYVGDAVLWANRKNEQDLQLPNLLAQFKVGPSINISVDELQHPANGIRFMARYFIPTGLRILMPGTDPAKQNLIRDDLAVEIEATFVAHYAAVSQDQPDMAMLEAFNDNAVHHVWPYWREFLQAAAARLRLPPIVLPMRVVQPQVLAGNVTLPTGAVAAPSQLAGQRVAQ